MNYEEQTYGTGWVAVAVLWTVIAVLNLASIYFSKSKRVTVDRC
jgi:hypothetical protein